MENTELEVLAQKFAERVDRLVREQRWNMDSALAVVMRLDEIQYLPASDKGSLEHLIRAKTYEISLERARLSASSGQATGFVSGKIPRRVKQDEREKYDRHELQLPRGDRD